MHVLRTACLFLFALILQLQPGAPLFYSHPLSGAFGGPSYILACHPPSSSFVSPFKQRSMPFPPPERTGWQMLLDEGGAKKFGAHSERNQGPILEGLKKHLPAEALDLQSTGPRLRVLEVASGTGQHAYFLASNLHVTWVPTDFDPTCIASTEAWTKDMSNVEQPPLVLDASAPFDEWPIEEDSVDVVYNTNMIHIAPYAVMEGFIAGAGKACRSGGMLFIYGPFKVGGQLTPESNVDFDRSLRARDPSFGIRDLEDVQQKADRAGFSFVAKEEMPANNFMLVFAKR